MMKKQIFALAFLGLMAFGCGGSKTENQAENIKIEKEVTKNDSLADEMEKANGEIKKASENLDALLEDL